MAAPRCGLGVSNRGTLSGVTTVEQIQELAAQS
jgi:hypothetical protein